MRRRTEPGPSVFVGRERELAELLGGLAGLRDWHGVLFLVCGEPGIGKTRLADELAREADRAGALVLWGRCREAEGRPPTGPGARSSRRARAPAAPPGSLPRWRPASIRSAG